MNTKALREGAMMTALSVILILLVWYVPLFSTIGVFFAGVPMAALVARNNIKTVIIAVLATFLVSFMVIGDAISSACFIAISVFPTTIAGFCMSRKKNFFISLAIVSIAVLLACMFELQALKLIGGQSLSDLTTAYTSQFKEVIEKYIETLGNNASAVLGKMTPDAFANEIVSSMELVIKNYFPSMIVIVAIIIGYISYMVCAFMLKRIKVNIGEIPSFSALKAPRSMSTVAVLLYIILFFTKGHQIATVVITNVVFVLFFIIGICGFSFIDYKIRKKIRKNRTRALIYILAFVLGFMLISLIFDIFVIVGVIDSNSDFRRLERMSDNE